MGRNISDKLREKVKSLPETPGVYIYYNKQGKIIYVGKAVNLRRRVASYFNRDHESLKTRRLVQNIADLQYHVVNTENDALILENSLIKKHKPHYNILLKDDKSYPWICITNETYPRVFRTHNYIKKLGKYFGPYTNQLAAKTVLKLIYDLYPIRSCRLIITPKLKKTARVCLEYHLKRCRGCCVEGMISEDEYQKYIDQVKQILRGETAILLTHLRNEMETLSKQLRFEEAHELKQKYIQVEKYQSHSAVVSQTVSTIDVFGTVENDNDLFINYLHISNGVIVSSYNLHYKRMLDETISEILAHAMLDIAEKFSVIYNAVIVQVHPAYKSDNIYYIIPQRGDKKKLLDISIKNAESQLNDYLNNLEKFNPDQRRMRTLKRLQSDFRLKELPHVIECFDNSSTQGTNAVASCVVFRDGKPSKKEYRHFIIKEADGQDDYAQMREVITRRYTRLLQEKEKLPQMIVVDGGKGQLNAAVDALESIGLRGKIAVIGIAKRLDEIYFPGDNFPLYIDKNSESLKVVQHLRDEAHRTGIKFHRNRRSKSQIHSELDNIVGIGEKSREALLRQFKSMKRVKEATIEQLSEVVGADKANKIHSHFHTPVETD